MHLDCPACGHLLEFSRERPSFCAYCGKPLPQTPLPGTAPFDPEATRPAVTRPGGEVVAPPTHVGSYRLLRPLGSGGMGTVYEAADGASGRRFALKLIAPEFAASPDAVERFRQEGRLASLIAHPRCVFVFAADEEAGQPYIVMELMSGSTLQDLADKHAPLPPADAVAKILDVIEGLQEAHRLGVIHRDVKPSNCFLLPDGRVKVGDFGLAKSLVADANLTRSGTFLGTLLYAPPEQIKGEEIDFRTDVYSVAATLYHLLTARPPFLGKDPAATLARTVSERAPPLRSLRPDLPKALDRVVLRGLERDRADRWRDLEEFRQALQPFAPRRLAPAGPAVRLGAFLIDFLLVLPLWAAVIMLFFLPAVEAMPFAVQSLGRFIEFLPLALLEGIWGWSPGKWLLRLRVCGTSGSDPPGLARGLLRALVFYGIIWGPAECLRPHLYSGPGLSDEVGLVMGVLELLGLLLTLSTMRRRSGYRGVHEWLSGTRVVRLPWPERRQTYRSRRPERPADLAPLPAALPERLGPYLLRGTLRGTADETLVLGEDAMLGRGVWLRVVPAGSPPPAAVRRELNRPTRLPWLNGGEHDGVRWDAFLAPQGCPLPDLVDARAPLSWGQFRPLLLQLTDELVAACADGTLPAALTVGQVWVHSGGRVQLLDAPPDPAAAAPADEGDSARALALLRQVVVLALEGRLPGAGGKHVHAPLPGGAVAVLDRLTGAGPQTVTLGQIQEDLIALQGDPPRVTAAMRSAHLVLLAAVLAPVLLVMLASRYITLQTGLEELYRRVAQANTALDHFHPEHATTTVAWIADSEYLRRHTPAEWCGLIVRRLQEDRKRWEALRQVVEWDWPARVVLLEAYWRTDINRVTVPGFGPQDFEWVARVAESDHFPQKEALAPALIMVVAPPLLCVVWALLTRGGFTFGLTGMSLRRSSGRRAGRLQSAWRALVFWTPVTAPLALSAWLQTEHPERALLAFALWCAAAGVVVGYALLAMWFPARSLHDRLAGTYLVPQ